MDESVKREKLLSVLLRSRSIIASFGWVLGREHLINEYANTYNETTSVISLLEDQLRSMGWEGDDD